MRETRGEKNAVKKKGGDHGGAQGDAHECFSRGNNLDEGIWRTAGACRQRRIIKGSSEKGRRGAREKVLRGVSPPPHAFKRGAGRAGPRKRKRFGARQEENQVTEENMPATRGTRAVHPFTGEGEMKRMGEGGRLLVAKRREGGKLRRGVKKKATSC